MIASTKAFPSIILFGVIVLSFLTGQGGNRLGRSGSENGRRACCYRQRQLLEAGDFLIQSLFIEKRVGIGWTVSIGRPLGKVLMVQPFVFVIVVVIVIEVLAN